MVSRHNSEHLGLVTVYLTNVAADGRVIVARLSGMKVESPAAELGR